MRQPLVEVRLWEEALADSRFFRTRYICNSANSEKIWKFSSVLSINSFVSHLHNCRSGQSLQLANVRLTGSSFASLNSPQWLETVTGDETGLTSQLISAPSLPTQPMKGCTTPPGSTPPTLYEQQCGFFHVPQESEQWKSWHGPTVFRSYPRRLECLAICRCHSKDSTLFSSVILRPWVLVRPGFELSRDLPLGRPALNQLS